MSKKENKFQLRMLIPLIPITLMLTFALYILSEETSSVDKSMNTSNFTDNCDHAAYVKAQGVDKYMLGGKVPTDMTNSADQAWSKYGCQNVLLTDTFGNTCYGSTGFITYDLDKNGGGRFYCSNIDRSVIDNKVQGQTIK